MIKYRMYSNLRENVNVIPFKDIKARKIYLILRVEGFPVFLGGW